ncbi:hypothetical protein [Acidimangrovimonas pyrenivorans]|uniref:Uncharacterized protein n=1 Tax=Acidimangrovimonas pyrenivorans TaxID=2030798 RepID=A0ABV7ACM5_9RHOB
MQDKQLDRAEFDLLAVIRQIHATQGPVERSALSVTARGQGVEVARPLVRLKQLGLVEEFERRPSFFKRLFGARPMVMLRPTVAAEAVEGPAGAPPAEVAAAPEAAPEPAEAPATEAPVPPAAVPETVQEAVPQAPAPAAGLAAAAPLDAAPEKVTPAAPAPAPVADAAAPAEAPADDDVAPRAAPPRPVAARRRPAPRRVSNADYTEDLGGVPMDDAGPTLSAGVDPEILDGLREMLGVLGMELTLAGEALIGDRMAKGVAAGEALSQVVLFAFAHAVRASAASDDGAAEMPKLSEYAVEVMRELEKLRDAGAIEDARFEADMRQLWAMVQDDPAQAETLLADPVGGAAPPALLPEDQRPIIVD